MKLISTLFFACLTIVSVAQISHGGKPLTLTNNSLNNYIPVITTSTIDKTPLEQEDLITDNIKEIPWRFGVEIPLNLSLTNSGVWETLPNGDRVWRLTIVVPGALSTNINYQKFYLPQNATFFVFNKNTTLGAFNSSNNKDNLEFATSLIKGNEVTLEYYEPSTVVGQGIIEIASIVHGYRDLFKQLKAFGSSGNCNVNAVCDTTIWGDEIRSIVMLLTAGNSRFCSGALVNNTLNNGIPYVLTAQHCSPGTNNIFMFNYQSANCTPSVDGPTNQTVVGATLIANDAPSDFYLIRLSNTPPANYNVFYAGWNAIDTPSTQSVGIHHPAGDVKKISHDFDPVVSSGYYATGNNHWQVLDWNTGTTEGGSSGSPLFDQNHRIVGQLHGGDAACGNEAFDYYGKFATSWNTNPDTLKQLKHWLDPNNSGITQLNGYDPNGSNYMVDATPLSIIGIEKAICGDSTQPIITIQNKGNNTLTSLIINYSLDGLLPTQLPWTGNLASYQTTTITLPQINNITDGSHVFTVFTSNPNGATDQNMYNDTIQFNFRTTSQPLFATLNLTTDNFGSETSWIIRNTLGEIVLEGGGYSNVNGGQLITESLCLAEECYTFVLYDSFGDGFCCGFGSGNVLLTEDATSDTLVFDNTFSGDSLIVPFCMGNATVSVTKNKELANLKLYPNPATNQLTITGLDAQNTTTISIIDLTGKTVFYTNLTATPQQQINISQLTNGVYFIKIHTPTDAKVIKFVKQ
ncbi:MAG: T9SS type A sorting domain-containing protein [Vicingaceae bacterium]|nr:T9SS type A sorting domain-containing protein [Vicingaceae bacterium]